MTDGKYVMINYVDDDDKKEKEMKRSKKNDTLHNKRERERQR